MVDPSIFIDKLPLFLLIQFILSYLVWSKFLNGDKLKLKNVNDIFDILAIFSCIAISMGSIILLFYFLNGALRLEINLDRSLENISNFITFISILFIFALGVIFRNQKPNINNFKEIVYGLVSVWLIVITTMLAFYIGIMLTFLRVVLWDIILILPMLILGLAFCLVIIQGMPFKINLKKRFVNKRIFKAVVVCALSIVVITSLFLPIISYKKENVLSYEIYDTWAKDNSAYKRIEVPIKIKTFGIVGSLAPMIPLKYGAYGLITENVPPDGFKILLNKSGHTYPTEIAASLKDLKEINELQNKPNSIEKVAVNEERGLAIIRFDENKIKEEAIKGASIIGLIPLNLTESEFYYKTNLREINVCKNNLCAATFEIFNRLDKPLLIKRSLLFNLVGEGATTPESCKFNGFDLIWLDKEKYKIIDSGCLGSSCDILVKNKKNGDKTLSIELHKDGQTIERNDWTINEQINFRLYIYLSCNE